DRRSQSNLKFISPFNGIIQDVIFDNRQHRPKLLDLHQRVILGNIGNDRGWIKVARLVTVWVTSSDDSCSGFARVFDQVGDNLLLGPVLKWSQYVVFRHSLAHRYLVSQLGQV